MGREFKNITISGGVAAGTTTLLDALRPSLEPEGFKLTSTGNIVREMLSEHDEEGHHKKNPLAELVEADQNRLIEQKVHDILDSGKKYVIEGWLAGFTARDIDHTLRVLVHIEDFEQQVRRFMDRESVEHDEAVKLIHDRQDKNFDFWKSLYGDYNFWDPQYYDVVIDTSNTLPDAAAAVVLEAFGAR